MIRHSRGIVMADKNATISGNGTGFTKEDGTLTATGKLTVSDPDGAAFNSIIASSGKSAGNYGSYSILANGEWTYTLNNSNAAVQALGAGDKLTDSFVVESADHTKKTIT